MWTLGSTWGRMQNQRRGKPVSQAPGEGIICQAAH